VQRAIAARIKPRLKRLGLSLDNTLEELRRRAYGRDPQAGPVAGAGPRSTTDPVNFAVKNGLVAG
jgi:hypothetical protein